MAEKLGLYVHIPFCRSKCDYCDFYSLAGKEGRMDDYQKALLHSTSPQKFYISFGTNKQVKYTIFIAGGREIFQWGHSACRMPGLFR